MELPEIEYLYNLRRFGMKLDLAIMRDFARLLGDPQDSMGFAHIAGTNGKGSTSSFLYNIMRQRYRTGIYTSPHIVRYNERIVVDGEEIPTAYIVEFVRRYRPVIEELAREQRNPTFFEVSTGLALDYFRSRNVEFAVMEVGLGGRLDATNIILPEVTAITTIDKDHTNILGKTLPKIAKEKAGIIKPGVPVVVGERKRSATKAIKDVAEKRGAEYHTIYDECQINDFEMCIDAMRFRLLTPVREYAIQTHMLGRHQIANISVAVRMAEMLEENYSITRGDIERGIEQTRWRGRFEIKSLSPLLIFDSAHNPAGAKVLSRTLRDLNLRPTLLFSMLGDKDIDLYFKRMSAVSNRIIVTEVSYHRRMPVEEIEKIAKNYFKEVISVKSPCEALRIASQFDTIVACGSIYLLGELEQCSERWW